jgi:hypothetical protein
VSAGFLFGLKQREGIGGRYRDFACPWSGIGRKAALRLYYSFAAAFTTVVTSFVSEILLPPISLLPFINKNLEEKFAVLRAGPNRTESGYNTLQQAADDGAVVMAYG